MNLLHATLCLRVYLKVMILKHFVSRAAIGIKLQNKILELYHPLSNWSSLLVVDKILIALEMLQKHS